MTKCKGLTGLLYGHIFTTYTLNQPTYPLDFNGSISNDEVLKYLEYNTRKQEIRCSRCGVKPDDK